MAVDMANSVAMNCDCMDYLRSLPDKAFDIAVVDPPYGAGFTEGGGCKGWFAKYHQDSSQSLNVEREREREREAHSSITDSEAPDLDLKSTSVTRTGGTWAEKYGKKS